MNPSAESQFDDCSYCRPTNRRVRRHQRGAGVAVGVIAAVIIGAAGEGMAAADPEQGGVTPPSSTAPGQGGVTPPSQLPDPGPQALPAPPIEAAPREAPDYSNNSPDYSPAYFQGPSTNTPAYNAPSQPLHLPTPTPNVRPIAIPKDEKIVRIGKYTTAQGVLTDAQRRTVNNYSAYLEAKIAQGLISVGFSPREADRQAAATTIGAVLGGTAGALALGVPVAVVAGLGGALVGAGVGAGIGALVPPEPINVLPGLAIGAGVGAAGGLAIGAGAALAGAVAGGVLGGLAGYLLGGGDPNAHPANPLAPAPGPKHAKPAPAPLPNPEGNQYELTADKTTGLPGNGKVSYVVKRGGDVSIDANIAGQQVHAGWTKAQADAPLKALGAAQTQARHALDQATKQVSDAAARAVRGLHIDYPQTHPVTPARHR